jgi:hypothetical protein
VEWTIWREAAAKGDPIPLQAILRHVTRTGVNSPMDLDGLMYLTLAGTRPDLSVEVFKEAWQARHRRVAFEADLKAPLKMGDGSHLTNEQRDWAVRNDSFVRRLLALVPARLHLTINTLFAMVHPDGYLMPRLP